MIHLQIVDGQEGRRRGDLPYAPGVSYQRQSTGRAARVMGAADDAAPSSRRGEGVGADQVQAIAACHCPLHFVAAPLAPMPS
jgi:hypothetical protein